VEQYTVQAKVLVIVKVNPFDQKDFLQALYRLWEAIGIIL